MPIPKPLFAFLLLACLGIFFICNDLNSAPVQAAVPPPNAAAAIAPIPTPPPTDVSIRKKADAERSAPDTDNGYTLVATNYTTETVTLTVLTDTLPAGFAYVAGTTTGFTTADPVINGQNLVWQGSFIISSTGTIQLHFTVHIAPTIAEGVYYNSARIAAVRPSGQPLYFLQAPDVAPVTIPPPTVATGNSATTPSGSVTTDPATGEIEITMRSGNRTDTTITSQVVCPVPPGGTPTSVTLKHNGFTYAMTETAIGSGRYQATIPAANIGNGAIEVVVTCAGTPVTNTVGTIHLYDPSGLVTDAVTGQPIQGATVTLYRVPGWRPDTDTSTRDCRTLDTRGPGGWTQAAPTNVGVLSAVDLEPAEIEPTVNPQLTNNEGRYGWNVVSGCWYVTVEAAGYETKISPVVGVPPAVTDLNLQLSPKLSVATGWNLLALPGTPTNGAPSALFSTIANQYNLVYAYNGCTAANPWQKYNPSGPVFANTLANLGSSQGFWIRGTSATALVFTGTKTAPVTINLCVGWNLISYPSNAPVALPTALASIASKYNLVYAYNAATPANPWRKYNPTGPAFANTLTEMRSGVGYWIRVTEATVLTVN